MNREFRMMHIALTRLYKSTLGFEEGTDVPATIEGIKKDISFRGHSAWILMFSILIASIGLNVNSTAVIIGAMLISPLMGPILGIGLSIGINDFETLLRSLRNFGIAVFISLATSTLYFSITPLDVAQTELLARTQPTLLDVLVAFFGGFAGIIAGSRKEKSNVIPGVAIATALMPPLCTAGYGLAKLNMAYFLGAFYLFFINSVFISFATLLVVRYLKFPLAEMVEPQKLKRYQFFMIAFLIVVVIPSAIIFYQVIQETRFKVAVENFIKQDCEFDGSELIGYKFEYNDTLSVIHLYYFGSPVNEEKMYYLKNRLLEYNLSGETRFPITEATEIVIHQESEGDNIDLDQRMAEFNDNLRLKVLEDIYTKNNEIIKSKDLKIQLLEAELLKTKRQDTLPYLQIDKELKYHFPEVAQFSYSKSVEVFTRNDSIWYDTFPVFLMKFKDNTRQNTRIQNLQKANEWLQMRFDNKKIKALEY
ncbi:MAG TPA: DUF389 domain-containing protein [Saprospiraceae bacterium]|nr:DUF389 domain-containing protein [Saprospiraceae bacterium]HMQ82196.1 DUF389 domain-containing protein [Saprospiraceae bacterium]